MAGVLWFSHERVLEMMPPQFVTPLRLAVLQKPIMWMRNPYPDLQVGDPMPRQHGGLHKLGRALKGLAEGVFGRPTGFFHGLLQFVIGFGLGRTIAVRLATGPRRAWFYLGTQAAFGKAEGYMLGGLHMGVMRGDIAKFTFAPQVKRTTERELVKEVLRRVTKKPRFQMPSAPGIPGMGWMVPLIASGVGVAVTAVTLGAKLLFGDAPDTPPPVPPPLTSIPDSAKQFTMPLGAWFQTGNAIWGAFLSGIVLGRLLSQRED